MTPLHIAGLTVMSVAVTVIVGYGCNLWCHMEDDEVGEKTPLVQFL